jgi:hypothetical protein
MKIKRRNPNFLIEMLIAMVIIFAPIIVLNSLLSISPIPNIIIFWLSAFACSYYFKRKSLSEEEISCIKSNAKFKIERKIYETDFLSPIFLVFLLIQTLTSDDIKARPIYFVFCLILILSAFISYLRRIYTKSNFREEGLYFLPTQIVFFNGDYKVINIAEINVLKLTASSLHLNTMHGSLDVKIKKLPQDEKKELMLYLSKIAGQTAAIPERINISI